MGTTHSDLSSGDGLLRGKRGGRGKARMYDNNPVDKQGEDGLFQQQQQQQQQQPTFYDLLQVPTTASRLQIKQSYLSLSKMYDMLALKVAVLVLDDVPRNSVKLHVPTWYCQMNDHVKSMIVGWR